MRAAGYPAIDQLAPVWTYGTGLELNSPRFTQPGDFFTYLVFVATTIFVSLSLDFFDFSSFSAWLRCL
jgi:hypothetical protein